MLDAASRVTVDVMDKTVIRTDVVAVVYRGFAFDQKHHDLEVSDGLADQAEVQERMALVRRTHVVMDYEASMLAMDPSMTYDSFDMVPLDDHVIENVLVEDRTLNLSALDHYRSTCNVSVVCPSDVPEVDIVQAVNKQ